MPDSDLDVFNFIALPHGNWKIIGLHSSDKPLSEEQCRLMIDDCHFAYPDFTIEALNGDNICLKSASESLESWMRKQEIYTMNPYGEKEPEDISDLGAFTQFMRQKWVKWKDAEKRTGSWIFLRAI
jgi:hypothetical protein